MAAAVSSPVRSDAIETSTRAAWCGLWWAYRWVVVMSACPATAIRSVNAPPDCENQVQKVWRSVWMLSLM